MGAPFNDPHLPSQSFPRHLGAPPMTSSRPVEIDLSQMKSALEAMQCGVTSGHLLVAEQFVEEIGGIEDAHAAVEMLIRMELGDISDAA